MSTYNVIDPNIIFKRKLLLILFIILLVVTSFFVYYYHFLDTKTLRNNQMPVQTWFHRFKKSDADNVHSLIQTEDGYLVLGDTSPQDRNSYIKAFDMQGETLWEKVLQSNVNHTNPVALVLKETYLVSYQSSVGDTKGKSKEITGYSVTLDKVTHRVLDRKPQIFKTITPAKEGYITSGDHNKLFRYDNNGTLLWEKRYSRGDFFTGLYVGETTVRYKISKGKILKLFAVEDENFFVLGRMRKSGSNRGVPWLFKIDKNGTVLWEKVLKSAYAYPSDFSFAEDGGYLVLLSDSKHRQIHCQKYDKNGTLLWRKNYSHPKKSLSWHMAQTGDGDYILTGSTILQKSVRVMWLLKIDHKGKLLWQKKRTSDIGDVPTTMISTLDGGVLIGGHASKQGDYVKKMYKGHILNQFKQLEEGAWLLKLDKNAQSSDVLFEFETTQSWREI